MAQDGALTIEVGACGIAVDEAVESLEREFAAEEHLPGDKRRFQSLTEQFLESAAKRHSTGVAPEYSRLNGDHLHLGHSAFGRPLPHAFAPPVVESPNRQMVVHDHKLGDPSRTGSAGLDQAMNSLIKDWCVHNGVPAETIPQWIFSNRFWRHNRGEPDAREWGLRRATNPVYPGLVVFGSIRRGDVDDSSPACGGQPGGHFFFICKMIRKLVELSGDHKLKPLLDTIPHFTTRAQYKDNVGRFRDIISGYRAKVESDRRAAGPCRRWSKSTVKQSTTMDLSGPTHTDRGNIRQSLTEDCHIAAEELAALAALGGCPSPTVLAACGATSVSSSLAHLSGFGGGCCACSGSSVLGAGSPFGGGYVGGVSSSPSVGNTGGACGEEKKAKDCRLAVAAELALLAEKP